MLAVGTPEKHLPHPPQTSTSSGARLKTCHSVIHQGDQEPCDGEAERLNVEEGLQSDSMGAGWGGVGGYGDH